MTFGFSREICPDESRFRSHIHLSYELLYFVEGDADYVIGSSVYRMKKNLLLFIKPSTCHNLRLHSAAPYARYIVNFYEDEISPSLRPLLDMADSLYEIPEDSFIHHFFGAWAEATERFSPDELEALVKNGVTQILLFLKHHSHKAAAPIKQNPTLNGILTYIDEHPAEAITAELLSAKFFVSPSWISHTFQKHLGFSLLQYITEKRMLYARQLIGAGHSPTDAAALCGFDSYPTFYRQYRKIHQKSPR